MISIFKAHLGDQIFSSLLSWAYHCFFVVLVLHIIKTHLNNPTILSPHPKQKRLGKHFEELSSLNFHRMQKARTRNKPTLTCNNNNLTYKILTTTRSSLSWSSHYDGYHGELQMSIMIIAKNFLFNSKTTF
jgi:hypothetical protein